MFFNPRSELRIPQFLRIRLPHFFVEREAYAEGRAASRAFALGRDRAAVEFDEVARDGEAEAEAAEGAGS